MVLRTYVPGWKGQPRESVNHSVTACFRHTEARMTPELSSLPWEVVSSLLITVYTQQRMGGCLPVILPRVRLDWLNTKEICHWKTLRPRASYILSSPFREPGWCSARCSGAFPLLPFPYVHLVRVGVVILVWEVV